MTNYIIIMGIILFIIHTFLYILLSKNTLAQYDAYLKSLSIFSIFIAIIGFIINSKINENNDNNNKILEVNKQQEQLLIDVYKIFTNNPELTQLYKELNMQDKNIQQLIEPPNINATNKLKAEHILCTTLIKRMELIYDSFSQIESYSKIKDFQDYINIWVSWFKSNIIKNYWENNKNVLFSHDFVNFINTTILTKK